MLYRRIPWPFLNVLLAFALFQRTQLHREVLRLDPGRTRCRDGFPHPPDRKRHGTLLERRDYDKCYVSVAILTSTGSVLSDIQHLLESLALP